MAFGDLPQILPFGHLLLVQGHGIYVSKSFIVHVDLIQTLIWKTWSALQDMAFSTCEHVTLRHP